MTSHTVLHKRVVIQGDRVIVTQGPLAGMQGRVVSVAKREIRVKLDGQCWLTVFPPELLAVQGNGGCPPIGAK